MTPEGSDHDLVAAARAAGVAVSEIGPAVMRALTDTATPQGVMAVVDMPDPGPEEALPTGDLLVVLAGIRDPGNAGTLLRSAAAAAASGVVFTKGSVDPFSPKTVRAAAGAFFHVPIASGIELSSAVAQLGGRGIQTVGTSATASRTLDEVDLTEPIAIVLGNEAWGLDAEDAGLLDVVVSIPMPGGMESLNVGVAGSIVLFETVRQRRLSSGDHV